MTKGAAAPSTPWSCSASTASARSSSASGSSSTARRSAAQTSAASAGVPGVLATSSTSRARMARHSGSRGQPTACSGGMPCAWASEMRSSSAPGVGSPAGRGAGRRPGRPSAAGSRPPGFRPPDDAGARRAWRTRWRARAAGCGECGCGLALRSRRAEEFAAIASPETNTAARPAWGRAAVRPVRSGKATGYLPAGFLSCSRNQAR